MGLSPLLCQFTVNNCILNFSATESELEIPKDNVGRMPWKEGGLRLEIKDLNEPWVKKRIVHAYGIGGCGYEIS